MKYKLVLSYEGTHYAGWQLQPHAISIQGELERVLTRLLQHPCRPVGAGRTDAGVHACGQVAHITTTRNIELHALNSLLPKDIRVLSLTAVDDTFHAQYDATRKIYRYRIWQEAIVDPFVRRTVHHYTYPLSLSALQEALPLLEGEHDFASFANHAERHLSASTRRFAQPAFEVNCDDFLVGPGPCASTDPDDHRRFAGDLDPSEKARIWPEMGVRKKSTVRTLYRVSYLPLPGGFGIEFEGNGFLYKMVRNLMGTLLDIGRGKRTPDAIPQLFLSKDRRLASAAAAASGLCLMRVHYIVI